MIQRLNKKYIVIVIFVASMLIIFGIFLFGMIKSVPKAKTVSSAAQTDLQTGRTTPAPLTMRQKSQLADQTSTSTKQKMFDVLAGNFYFTPNKIVVNKGDSIIINFMSRNGLHDLVINDLHIHTPLLQESQITVVRFTADKKGTFGFYSDTPPDKHYGMKGILVVQ